MRIKIAVFWGMTQCRLVGKYQVPEEPEDGGGVFLQNSTYLATNTIT